MVSIGGYYCGLVNFQHTKYEDMKDKIIEILKDMAVAIMTAEPTKLDDLHDFGFEFFAGLIEAKSKEEAEVIDEETLQQDFKDWLGWNDQDPPDKDDPDYYTYSWGMNVWCNAYKAYKAAFGKEGEG